MREEFLTQKLANLLERLSPPRSIAGNERAQAEDISHMLRVISAAAPAQDFAPWWSGFEARLLEGHETRAWPTVKEIKAACFDRGKKASSEASLMTKLRAVTDWMDGHGGKPHPTFNTEEITAALFRGGYLKNQREARFLGFALSEGQTKIAKTQRMGTAEWRAHVRVVASMLGLAEHDAEQREIDDIGHLSIPDEVLPAALLDRRARRRAMARAAE